MRQQNLIAITIVFVAALSGCARNSAVIGVWKDASYGSLGRKAPNLTIRANGTYDLPPQVGRWKMSGSTILFEPSFGKPWQMTLSQDKTVMSDGIVDGTTFTK